MNYYADVLLIESNDDDAKIALQAICRGLPSSNPLHLRSCKEALHYLFNGGLVTEQGKNVKLIVSEISKSGNCTVDFISAVKRNHHTRSIHLFSVLDSPCYLDLFSEIVKAGCTLCLVKSDDYPEKLKTEAGFYWQLFE